MNDDRLLRADIASATPARPQGRPAILPPVTHASTFLAASLDDFDAMNRTRHGDDVTYGVHGSPGAYAFETALAGLDGGHRTRLCQSGLAAITATLLSFLSAGDHLLMVDSCYAPVRRLCKGMLRRLGVVTTFYDPLVGADIRGLIRPNTRMIWLESPGSLTFEVQDVSAIAEIAAEADVWTAMDNTWASPLYFKPLSHGVDLSMQALTKYVAGHGDLVLGAVTATRAAYDRLQSGWYELGHSAGPDDVYLAHRGLQTLELRMRRHWETGVRLAEWLAGQPEVAAVHHPALPDDPGHALWRRDFAGAGGLFSVTLSPQASDRSRLEALIDPMRRFGLGFSWGGPMSLLIPCQPATQRSATRWPREGLEAGATLRVFAGLEDPDELIDDLAEGFARLRAA